MKLRYLMEVCLHVGRPVAKARRCRLLLIARRLIHIFYLFYCIFFSQTKISHPVLRVHTQSFAAGEVGFFEAFRQAAQAAETVRASLPPRL